MKLKCDRYSIKIYPENEIEEAYLEEVIGAKPETAIEASRVNAFGLHSLAYIELKKSKKEKDVIFA